MQRRMLIGLVGTNIGSSLSPTLHEDAFAAAGVVGHYHLMDVARLEGRSLTDLLNAVRAAGFAGINVTQPFKEAVIPLLDAVSAEAREIGAVNTVVIGADGRTSGHNTDRSGFRRGFEKTLGRATAERKRVLLLGAGGAGRAVAFALVDLGVAYLMIHDTDRARAKTLCADVNVAARADRCVVVAGLADAAARADGIVNATPMGMHGYGGIPIDDALVRPAHFVADVVYTPLHTAFIARASAKGCRAMTGGSMCEHQAADAFRLFTGIAPDVARMQRLFDRACAARDAALGATA